ncbi:MAG: methyl-accepting chemotaxis protein [Lachnospiraceae bacterium]|nr:methyl-accepting chemotaxis protein [Lachnospiraceae bacterium]
MNKLKEIKEKKSSEKPAEEKVAKEKPIKEKKISIKKVNDIAAPEKTAKDAGEKVPVKEVLKNAADKAKFLFDKAKGWGAKLSKEPKDAKEKKPVSKFVVQLFSIRNKIFVCFLIPIIFMIVVGTVAYNKAAEGMQEKYQESTLQTINMVNEYIELNSSFIATETMKYAFDDGIHKYAFDMISDLAEQKEVVSSTKKNFQSTQKTNELISNFHMIPPAGANVITTKTAASVGAETDGFYNEYLASTEMDGKTPRRWIDSHALLDEKLGVDEDDYIMAYQLQSNKQSFIMVVDIASEGIENLLKNMDLGEGSIIGFVTANGRELLLESVGEGKESVLTEGEKVFFGQEFFTPINEEDNMSGYQEVKFKGEKYLFLYKRSDSNHATICALVPMEVVTGQAESIKSITVKLVLLAIVIAALIGIWIAAGITGNMKRISRRFGEVAKGDLTVKVTAKGKDEFNQLAASATDMIYNNKKLVSKVNRSTDELAGSAQEVKDASFIISDYSEDITAAISGINEGMQKQSEYAQFCVEKTSALSDDMQEVSNTVDRVETLVRATEKMIADGMSMVQVLGERAQETTAITAQVGDNIDALKKETGLINQFVETIAGISQQTNLLSLNASIEAARAGDAGRGFAVVAEEIRKLADDSAKAAHEIQNNVKLISNRTKSTVENAKQAEQMVALQTEVVEKVVSIFEEMNVQMNNLVQGLKDIVSSTEKADSEREETLKSVKNISGIIEENAENVRAVNGVTEKLQQNVENLNRISGILSQNMEELKGEISAFKTE